MKDEFNIGDMLDHIGSLVCENTDESSMDIDNQNETESNLVKIPISDGRVKPYADTINKLTGEAHINYSDLTYNSLSDEIKWDGLIDKMKWYVVYNEEVGGEIFITSDNIPIDSNTTKGLNKLVLYFESEWFPKIRDAILNKEFTKSYNG